MTVNTNISVLERSTVEQMVQQDLMAPMDIADGFTVLDCSDDRSLTEDYLAERIAKVGFEPLPGRYFGALSGVVLTSMIAYAAEHGEGAVSEIIDEYSPEAFVDYGADLSHRAFALDVPLMLNNHSDASREKNPTTLGERHECSEDLGCKFAAALGAVLHQSLQTDQLSESERVLSEIGHQLPLAEALEGIEILARHIGPEFSIGREEIRYARTKRGLYAPVAIHEGKHAPNEQAALIIDIGSGYRSSATKLNQVGTPRYHHTLDLPRRVLSEVMPEIQFDPDLLAATGLLLASSTRRALSGPQSPSALRIEIIPPEYAQAA